MHKKYVLDTSVIVYDPDCFRAFKDNDVIIPVAVLEELDGLKVRSDNVGTNARTAIRKLDMYCNGADIRKGIDLGDNIKLFIDVTNTKNEKFDAGTKDDSILACVMANKKAIIVSKDINMRLRAKAFGVVAQDYQNDYLKNVDELFTGYRCVNLDNEGAVAGFTSDGGLESTTSTPFEDMAPNEFVQVKHNGKNSLFRKHASGVLKPVKIPTDVWGIKSKNMEQAMAFDLLLDPNVHLVSLIGIAGSGKTLLSCAAGLEQVINKKIYKKTEFFKSIMPVGRDVGFLPGPQPLDAKILTPTGWTTMGELKVGDEVISRDGKPSKVIGIFPKGKKSIYKVTVSDGASTECCEDHLWYTETFKEKFETYINKDMKANPTPLGKIRTTKEIIDTLNKTHYLPRNEAVMYNQDDSKLPIPPYTFGALLGDGHLGGKIVLHNTDKELIDRVDRELLNMECTLRYNGRMSYHIISVHQDYRPGRGVLARNTITGEETTYRSVVWAAHELGLDVSSVHRRCNKGINVNGVVCEFIGDGYDYDNVVKNQFFKLGLLGKTCESKFIPNIYKYSSIKSRTALLQGLMDTDGTIKKDGGASYCTTSKQLALDVIEIVKSLGGRAVLRTRNRVGKSNICNGNEVICRRESYEFDISLKDINPFYISRKASRHNFDKKLIHNQIVSIEPAGEKEVQCILIDNPEHLYITDGFIVTHNTLNEKLAPWMGSIKDALEFLSKNTNFETFMGQYKDRITMEALTFVRGRSMNNIFIMLDEAQNLSKNEIKTLVTRAGFGSKIVLTGDIEQIDNSYLNSMDNGLTYVIEKFKLSKLSGHVTLSKGERSELATDAAKLL